ncbi:MAG: hypothetical protein ACK49D_10765 [Flavobacteriia bacterium]
MNNQIEERIVNGFFFTVYQFLIPQLYGYILEIKSEPNSLG